jgi:hypothetical protein
MQNFEHQAYMPYADPRMPSTREASVDPYHMPSTREPSLEPVWKNTWTDEYVAEQYAQPSIQQQWPHEQCAAVSSNQSQNFVPQNQSFAPQSQMASRELVRRSSRNAIPMQPDVNPPAQPYQTVLIVPQNQPVLFVRPGQNGTVVPANGIPMNNGGVMPYPVQTMPMMQAPHMQNPSAGMPPSMPGAEPTTAQPSEAASDATPDPEERPVGKHGKNKGRGYFKSDSGFNKMSAEQKEALCKYIFDFMVKKNFTSQEGYLIVDVFSEVWKDMGDSAEGWRVAQHRFGHLLRSSPKQFRLFRRGIRVANQCGWFARKGEKMVRLVLDKEK